MHISVLLYYLEIDVDINLKLHIVSNNSEEKTSLKGIIGVSLETELTLNNFVHIGLPNSIKRNKIRLRFLVLLHNYNS